MKWLKNIFQSESKEKGAEPSVYSLEEAENALSDLSKKDRENLISRLNENKETILAGIKHLEQELMRFKSTVPEEPRAVASLNIKNSFVSRAISSVGLFRNMNTQSIEEYVSFADSCKRVIESATVSPTEASHIKYFFDEEIREIAKIIREISQNITLLHENVQNYKKKFGSAESEISKIRGFLKQQEIMAGNIENKLREADRLVKEAGTLDVDIDEAKYSNVVDDVNRVENNLKQKEGALISTIAPFSKVLRKYQYKIASKEESKLIENYLQSPKTAIRNDESFIIADLLKRANELQKELDLDSKEIDKLIGFPGKDRLANLKTDIEAAEEKLQSKRSEIMPVIEERKTKVENKIRSEEMLKHAVILRQEAENDTAKIEEIKTSLEESKNQLSKEMTNLLGKNVKIITANG